MAPIQHPTPPVTSTVGAALRATTDKPVTGRKWLSWDDWARQEKQTAEYQPGFPAAQGSAKPTGTGGPVGARPRSWQGRGRPRRP